MNPPRLTNPILELEKQGLDVDDVLDGWQLFNEKCKARGLASINPAEIVVEQPVNEEVDENTVDGEGKIEE